MLTFEEIAIAFKGCNGETNLTFKDHLISLNLTTEEVSAGKTITGSYKYIFSDIEKLLDKALINICSADHLMKSGFFSWGFVSSYYSNLFSIQALNRLQLNFHVWTDANIICKVTNYTSQELEALKKDKSKNSHEIQFSQFFSNYAPLKARKGIDRYWNIGLGQSKDGSETDLRNRINYWISRDYYYELELDKNIFKKIKIDNTKSPFINTSPSITSPRNYTLNNLQLGLCRIRMTAYILNYIANSNIEYRSYYERNMRRRTNNINLKFTALSSWIKEHFDDWLKYDDLELIPEVV